MRDPFTSYIPGDLEERLQEGIRHAMGLGADGAEAFVTVSRTHRAKVRNGALEELSASKRGGLGVRVLREGRAGLATTTDLRRTDFRALFEQAHQLAAYGDPDPWLRQAEPVEAAPLPTRFETSLEALTPEARVGRAFELEAGARAASRRVSAVREASWRDGSGASLLLTQKGVRAVDLSSSCSASIELAVEEDGDRQAAWHWDMGRAPGDLDLAGIGAEAARKGERKLKPRAFAAGRHPVLLHPEVSAELFGLVAEMLSAEEVLKGRSLFAGCLDRPVASPQLSLVDDGRLVHPDGRAALGSELWDGEGVPTRRTPLLQEGRLCSFLHTLRSAAEMGVAPTASAGRSPGSNPGVTTFNLLPGAGDRDFEALCRMAGTGVLITEIMGLHTVDPVSGDLSVGASGVMIRGGELAESVDRMTFAGNLKDFLQRIAAVGSDLRWYGSTAGLSLLLEEMSLGGA